jgi:hypothetical protein
MLLLAGHADIGDRGIEGNTHPCGSAPERASPDQDKAVVVPGLGRRPAPVIVAAGDRQHRVARTPGQHVKIPYRARIFKTRRSHMAPGWVTGVVIEGTHPHSDLH